MSWLDDERAAKWHPTHRKRLVLPERFREAVPANIPVPALKEVGAKYLKNFDEYAVVGQAPVFMGRGETWKTYTAACIAKWVERYAAIEVMFIDAGEFFGAYETHRFDPKWQAQLEVVKNVAFLVIDDFTNVRPKSVAADAMVVVASHRFGALRPTLWTGNTTAHGDGAKIAEVYGVALARRLMRASAGLRVILE